MLYKELGFSSFDEYLDYFLNSLLISNKTYQYFVDWNKVKEIIRNYLDEISLLNSIVKVPSNQREKRFFQLLSKYPRIAEIIPMIIAERVKSGVIDIFDPEIENFIHYEFQRSSVNSKNIPQIIKFCKKVGIFDLFEEIQDFHDYLLGVEVGLDTNARKNRSGDIFEHMVQEKIKRLLAPKYRQVNNDPQFSLFPVTTKGRSKGKTHDILIYYKERPILIIECNIYNTTGSKPTSIAESYIDMSRIANKKNIEFLWVTDGQGWLKMQESLVRTMNEVNWVFNYRMLDKFPTIIRHIEKKRNNK